MIYIAKYHRKTLRLYKERGISIADENDLPKLSTEPKPQDEVTPAVLSVQEQAMLVHHQTRFSKSHSTFKVYWWVSMMDANCEES